MSSPSTPFPWKGDARRAGVGRSRKRAKPTSGATRHLLPEEGGRSGVSNPPPSHGREMPEGRGLAESEKEQSQPPALRATSFQRKAGEVVKNHLPPSHGRGMPEGQGVGRRRKRAKPTSGATRHLLPKEGGRSGMSNPSTPFLWKGDARRAGGWPRGKERSQPPALRAASFQRKEGEVG